MDSKHTRTLDLRAIHTIYGRPRNKLLATFPVFRSQQRSTECILCQATPLQRRTQLFPCPPTKSLTTYRRFVNNGSWSTIDLATLLKSANQSSTSTDRRNPTTKACMPNMPSLQQTAQLNTRYTQPANPRPAQETRPHQANADLCDERPRPAQARRQQAATAPATDSARPCTTDQEGRFRQESVDVVP